MNRFLRPLFVVAVLVTMMPTLSVRAQIHQRLLETRPTAQQVNDILLPYLVAQKRHPTGGFELPATDVWWAWRSQYELGIEQPITNVMHLAAHNGYNALGDGFDIFPALAPNQILGLERQLDFGARLMEIDIHDTDSGYLEVFHFVDDAGHRDLADVLAEIRSWLDRNPHEILFIDVEDATEKPEGATADTSIDLALRRHFGDPAASSSLLFTPNERAELGRWPSRLELIRAGQRVIVLTHRNDAGDGRFGSPTAYIDPNGHRWYGAGLAFRADGAEDPVKRRGNFQQYRVQDLPGTIEGDPTLLANPDFFLSMQSDGIDQIPPSLFDPLLAYLPQLFDFFTELDANRARPGDVRRAARYNVNFLKMDFLFGHDEDAGLGSNAATFWGIPYVRDDAYEIENDGSRVKRLRFAIWSWLEGDPAVQRQIFQDRFPGDGSGEHQRRWIEELLAGAPSFIDELEAAGAAARTNQRDFAVQRSTSSGPDRRWISVTADGTTSSGQASHSLPFALRSTTRDPSTGRYRWKVSSTRGAVEDASSIPAAELVDGDGLRYVFAGPVNGLQNEDLYLAREAAGEDDPIWLNVNDTDRDGFWSACPCAPTLQRLVVFEPAIDEGGLARLGLLFDDHDQADVHTVTIDWGDGTAPSRFVLDDGERSLDAEHRYVDDDPSGTPSDEYAISVRIDDGITLPAVGQGRIRVRNVAPSFGSLVSSAPVTDPVPSGTEVTVAASYSDAGIRDTHTVELDWGDGTTSSATLSNVGPQKSFNAIHVFDTGGVFDVVATLRDDDTGTAEASTRIFVTGVGLVDGLLQIVGTSDRNVVTIHRVDGREIRVHADFLEDSFATFDPEQVEKIDVWVCGAQDRINVAANMIGVEVTVNDCDLP